MRTLLLLAGLIASSFALAIPKTAAPKDAKAYFISPKQGEVVTGAVTVRFGLSGMGVAPAGLVKENTGHHHLLVDAKALPDAALPIPNDAVHRHFGGGQTEVTLDLAPGKHTLQLLMGDASHMSFEPAIMSEKIEITVKAAPKK
jgi:hypothetical protein